MEKWLTARTAPPTSESSSPVVSQDRTLGLVIYLLFIRLEYELYVKSRACLFLRARPNAQRCAKYCNCSFAHRRRYSPVGQICRAHRGGSNDAQRLLRRQPLAAAQAVCKSRYFGRIVPKRCLMTVNTCNLDRNLDRK